MRKLLHILLFLAPTVQPATLTFEGLSDGSLVDRFYSALGLTFTGATAFIDSDDGGTGDFAGEPSMSTGVFSVTGIGINVPAGAVGSISMYYSNPGGSLNIRVFPETDWHGGFLIDSYHPGTSWGTAPDPTGNFGPFAFVSVPFEGTARSIAIMSRGPGGFFADDLTISTVPEAPGVWLTGLTTAALFAVRCYRRYRAAAPGVSTVLPPRQVGC
jgi:hypothetical protein